MHYTENWILFKPFRIQYIDWQKSAKVGGADIESSCRSSPVAGF